MTVLNPLIWNPPFDPAERKDYAIDWSDIVEADSITTSLWRLDAAGTAAGVEIDDDSIEVATKFTFAWFVVALAQQEDGGFSNEGISVLVTNLITTSANRRHERTAQLIVRQL